MNIAMKTDHDGGLMESKVADAILQREEEITVGDRTYRVAPPSVATLILASEAAGKMPKLSLDSEKIIDESLSVARYCRPLGDFVAILVLGAKGIKQQREVVEKVECRRWYGFGCRTREVRKTVEVDAKAELAAQLLEDLSPKELYALTAQLLSRMQIGDFFGLTTFLTELNLTRPTKVVNETTASGR